MPVVLAAACRTPFAPAEGELADWHPVDLTAAAINEVIARGGIEPGVIDEVWVGCAEPVGAQGADMARAAVLAAGWPDAVGGLVIERGETSGSAALHAAVAMIEAGRSRTTVVVGACSATMVAPGAAALGRTYGRPWGDAPAGRVEDRGGLLPPPRAADAAAAARGIDRATQDAASARSLERRTATVSPATMTVAARPGERVAMQKGTPLANDVVRTPLEDPSTLPPMFDDDGTVTAWSFAPPADGVTALLLTDGGGGRAELVAAARAAGDPLDPAGGIEQAVARAGVEVGIVDRWEILETTAAGMLVICDRLGIDPTAVNRNGGTLGVGDAGAAEELRLTVDGLAAAKAGELVATVAAGPTGSALTVWRRVAA